MNGKQTKIALSVALLLLGASLAVAFTSVGGTVRPAGGIIIDFGDREITYVPVDLSAHPDAMSALEAACESEGIEMVSDGAWVYSIDSRPEMGSARGWKLYVTPIGGDSWRLHGGDPSSVRVADNSAVAWALCADGEDPTPGVDATGVGYYGYPQAKRLVTLAPSVTETVVAIGGINAIVGTDLYSDYPESVMSLRDKGRIAVVGGYSNPSFELIMKESPDLVIGMASQAGHIQVIEKLRARGVNAVVAFDGESIGTILDNTHMIGEAMSYSLGADEVLGDVAYAMGEIGRIMDSVSGSYRPKVMVALSTAKSPWISGSGTYMSDILALASAENAYGSVSGWSQVNSESIFSYNPDYILVIGYGEGEDGYEAMIGGLPPEWKRTAAYIDGNIYSLDGSSANLASRPSPRAAQLAELVGRIVHQDAFGDGIEVPKYVGDGFCEYLTITKEMNFG
ncbi:MAG: helical backbone metal receptor [Candidatus Methanoplasma sp.]|jgi:iron complex transport system substrate-binding protein|nr:helical backbone metal receptor [Candidatus Methanoplasma sp.]